MSKALRSYQDDLDEDIGELVTAQSTSDADSAQRIQTAKADLAELFRKIENVRERASQTERAITEMTADIKRLDGTKRNLTLSMTALKRLQMLTTAYEQLRSLSKSRQYRDCAQLLQAVIQLMAHFKTYRSIDQIATLSRNVADLQRELLEQICEDFEITFAKGEVAQRKGTLSEACMVMDALGENARSRLITWYCNTQLREYRQVFRGNDEAGSLDNISRRYSWFRRMLKTYDDEHGAIFPASWRVNEMLANAFCEGTRDDFKSILSRSMRRSDGQTLDVNLLLSCLQETLEFEHSLERRFATDARSSIDTLSSRDEKQPIFGQAISEAFEPYLSIWVESLDKQLSIMVPKYRQQPLQAPDEDFSPQLVIPSSTELFSFYRLTLAQCAKLSTGSRLVELSSIFAKYLGQYAQQVLLYFLTERSGPQGPTLGDIILVLNTADYCHSTSTQLEEKIRGRVDEEFKATIDLQSQADTFMGIASAAVRALVRKVEIDCESSWREMRNTPWSKLDSVGDQSSYVAELLGHVKAKAAEILKLLPKQQFARAFCDNLVELLANTYIANIVQCRPVSEVGAEQAGFVFYKWMLLDSYVLKLGFEQLYTVNTESGTTAPAGYIKRVNQSMTKIGPLLKTLQVRSTPPEGLVQAYLIHISDASDTNFRKILELKGIRKQDQQGLVELFQAHRASPSNSKLTQHSPLLTPLQIGGALGGTPGVGGALGGAGGAGASLSAPSIQGRFDPSTFGSAIMSAARDGVDRFGSPALGASSANLIGPNHNVNVNVNVNNNNNNNTHTPSGTMSPPQGGSGAGGGTVEGSATASTAATAATANLNENLRNIGKFFRRDMGSFGGRFGSGRVSEDPGR
ncbi:MAG: Vacuolar protein sorting-associated protein 53 [Pycnora praestabilis]|nr:MAG: Vacuolar protein sorting-associated protein 53 [Pycnora praestabilis]